MEELVKIIGSTCLKHHDSGEASINKEAKLIIEALKEKGYEIILKPQEKPLQIFRDEIAKKHNYKNYEDAESRADTDTFMKINFEAEQKFEEYKTQPISPISDKPFATWLRTNNYYFKSRKGGIKMYENKIIEGLFARKSLYKKFKTENSQPK